MELTNNYKSKLSSSSFIPKLSSSKLHKVDYETPQHIQISEDINKYIISNEEHLDVVDLQLSVIAPPPTPQIPPQEEPKIINEVKPKRRTLKTKK